jgi:hypothetical protein
MLGKVERPWRALRDCDSSMPHAMSFSNRMCPCAIIIAVHLRNRTSTNTIGPAWGFAIILLTCAVPYASTFRVFGCVVFAKVPDNLRRELGMKAFRGVMVGCSPISNWYRVNNPTSIRVTTHAHVKSQKIVPGFGTSQPVDGR